MLGDVGSDPAGVAFGPRYTPPMTEIVAFEEAPPPGRAAGFRDWLGPDADRRRGVESALVATFKLWGYDLVDTPLIEPLDTVAAGVGHEQQGQLFRFMDADGSLLALVGERTVSVSRVVATQRQQGPFPLRLCYSGPVLRNLPLHGGRRREVLQAGCELIGAPGLDADAECIALAIEALDGAGLADIQVDAGHARFIPALLESAGLPDGARSEVSAALTRRDLVAVEKALEGTELGDAERRVLSAFPALRGGQEILDRVARGLQDSRVHAVIAELAELSGELDSRGLRGRYGLDLGAVRDWGYYTGPTFEIFSGHLGFPLGTGGRYDRLLAGFGLDTPATGFVLHVDRCHDALRRTIAESGADTSVIVEQGSDARNDQARAWFARALRARGVRAVMALQDESAPETAASVTVGDRGQVRWHHAAGASGEGSAEDAVASLAPKR